VGEKKPMPSVIKAPLKEACKNRKNHIEQILCFFCHFQLFLLRKLLSPNITPPQLNIQHPLHRTQHLLVRRRRTPLHILHYGDGRITFCGQFLLSHLVAFVIAAPFDSVADLGADGFGFDNVVAAVDFCEELAFGAACSASLFSSVSIHSSNVIFF
jgi:hypothetical protein